MRFTLSGLALFLATPVFALTAENIRTSNYSDGSVPEGQSGLSVKLQVLLDRAGVSPGVIDGYKGGMSESACADLKRAKALRSTAFWILGYG